MLRPKRANMAITKTATREARRAATWRWTFVSDPVSARKTGTAPGGSRITTSVMNVLRKMVVSKKLKASAPP